MKPFLRLLIRIILIFSGFIFIFSLPFLFGIGENTISFHFQPFLMSMETKFQSLIHINEVNYLSFFKVLKIAESYQYSMTILFSSLILVIFAGISLGLLILLAPKKFQSCLRSIVNVFEAVPDLLVIFLFMYFAITLYKQTGIKLFHLYGVFGVKPYFVPIMTVSVLPLFFFLQFILKVVTEEQCQQYVLYAKAKGISSIRILFVHIIRNIIPLLFLQVRTIVWIILSNIYLVEYIFNINGFTQQFRIILLQGGDFASLILCLLMLVFPLLVMEAGGWMFTRLMKGKEAVGI